MTSRRIVVVRHGETVSNRERIWQGRLDTGLSDLGVAQARAAAAALTAYRPAFVVSSDLRRASVTAELIASACGAPLTLDGRLREVDVGQWQGMPNSQVREEYADLLDAIARGEDVAKGITGERIADVAERVGAVLSELVARLGAGETALVVAHGVSGRVGVAWLIGLDQMVASKVLRGMDNCHWADVVEAPGLFSATAPAEWRLASWNTGARDLGEPGGAR